VVGRATDKQATELLTAERLIAEGRQIIDRAAPAMMARFGMVMTFPVDELRAAADFQRQVARNLHSLVKEALSPKALTRRATVRFPLLVIALFVMMLATVRITGMVETLTGAEAIKILLISLIVALTTSFGYEVALKFLPGFGFGSKGEST